MSITTCIDSRIRASVNSRGISRYHNSKSVIQEDTEANFSADSRSKAERCLDELIAMILG